MENSKHYSIEENGMLKILEKLYSILLNGRYITFDKIWKETGIEHKYWQRLIPDIIERSGSPKNPNYKWVAKIPPNIYMACEVLKDVSVERNLFETETNDNERPIKNINISFTEFWNLYDKKVGDKTKLEKKWNSLSDKDRVAIINYIPKYKEAQPDKLYRKDPQTFFNNKGWFDEIITKTYIKPFVQSSNNYPLSHYTEQQLWDELVRRGCTIEDNKLVLIKKTYFSNLI